MTRPRRLHLPPPARAAGAAAPRRALAPASPADRAEAPADPAHRPAPARGAHHRPRAARAGISAPDLLIRAAMLMALAAAGPAWRPAPSPFVSETAPLVVALDLSPSMTDAPTSRPPGSSGRSRRSATSIALRAGGRVGARRLRRHRPSRHAADRGSRPCSCPSSRALDPAIMPDQGRSRLRGAGAGGEPARPRGQRPARCSSSPTASIPPTSPPSPTRRQRPRRADRRARAAAPRSPTGRAAPASPPSPTTIDDGDVRAVQRALASSLARAAAAEGRLQDDGWLLAVPAALLAPALVPPRHHAALGRDARRRSRSSPARPRRAPTASPTGSGPPTSRAAASTRPTATPRRPRPSPTPSGAPPRSSAPASTRRPPTLLAPIQTAAAQYEPRHRARPRPRLSGRQGRLRGRAEARPRQRRRRAQPRRDRADHRLPDRGARQDETTRNEAQSRRTTRSSDLPATRASASASTPASQLSEDAADEWMRQVETKPADFLKSPLRHRGRGPR